MAKCNQFTSLPFKGLIVTGLLVLSDSVYICREDDVDLCSDVSDSDRVFGEVW